MYDILISLKKPIGTDCDANGNDITKYEENKAWCGELSVTQSEYYAAASRQFKPEKVIEIWDRDYNGEESCIIDGIEYEIYRTFHKSGSTKRELYLRLKSNGN